MGSTCLGPQDQVRNVARALLDLPRDPGRHGRSGIVSQAVQRLVEQLLAEEPEATPGTA
jgi:hypothetical protein